MTEDEVVELRRDIDRSVQMRRSLHERLGGNEDVDLIEEWHAIEQIDVEIANKIRKRPVE